MSSRLLSVSAAFAFALGGCAHDPGAGVIATIFDSPPAPASDAVAGWSAATVAADVAPDGAVYRATAVAWGEPQVPPAGLAGPSAVAEADGTYLLDTGDRLRVFVYGQPSLSRLYIVDHEGRITVPLIGHVRARGLTTGVLQGAIRARLGERYVRDPQVTVDVQQNRPFFILGEVRAAGQFPYVSGMTIETAVAIAGGYSERANEHTARITRRINGLVEVMDVPRDHAVQPGDTIYVYERLF
jgi:polysaccharide export outer membrane protein